MIPCLMKGYELYSNHRFAVGIGLCLAAIFISGCGSEAAEGAESVAEASMTAAPAVTATAKPATAMSTPSLAATNTATAVTSTPTAVRTKTATAVRPTPTVTSQPTNADTTRQTATTGVIKTSTTNITLPTYPIQDYLVEQLDPVYNIPALYFNRPAFEAAAPDPRPVEYEGVVLENAYVRLTFLPELGGRLYSAVVKATGQEIFYHNNVVKPSRYGVLQPYEANWWLAAGGMEWAYPTQEHGYRWGVPWTYEIDQNSSGATITLSDIAPDRVGVEVRVTLPANSAVFTVAPKLVNPTAKTVPVQFWLNAALALAPGSMSGETEFVVPVEQITVHSRGEDGWTVPDAHTETAWPIVGETDLRDYGQWANYLGFFMPYLNAPFMGAYNPATNLGVVRLVEPGVVPGNKLFAFSPTFPDRSYTDGDSQYFEIWGGANVGFWAEDDLLVRSGGILQWQEAWWPIAGLDGLTWANQKAAIYLDQVGNDFTLSALVPRPTRGTLIIEAGQTPLLTEPFSADPATPHRWDFSTTRRPVRVQLAAGDGTPLLEYCLPAVWPTHRGPVGWRRNSLIGILPGLLNGCP